MVINGNPFQATVVSHIQTKWAEMGQAVRIFPVKIQNG